MDKIFIRDMVVFAHHGVYDFEKENGQDFRLNIEMYADIKDACRYDELESTVNYAKVHDEVARVFTSEKHDLVERAAELVAMHIFESEPLVHKVMVRVEKLNPPIEGRLDTVGVEIWRKR